MRLKKPPFLLVLLWPWLPDLVSEKPYRSALHPNNGRWIHKVVICTSSLPRQFVLSQQSDYPEVLFPSVTPGGPRPIRASHETPALKICHRLPNESPVLCSAGPIAPCRYQRLSWSHLLKWTSSKHETLGVGRAPLCPAGMSHILYLKVKLRALSFRPCSLNTNKF